MDDEYAGARDRLLAIIEAEVRATEKWTGVAALGPAVRDALARVPRHQFTSRLERGLAYANQPLSIGHGQTISQPYIVAIMTRLLEPGRKSRVLEIGTGCGYQAAVLAEIAAGVWTVERIPALAEAAAQRLARLGYANVHVRAGDGSLGWPEEAPFDAIMVTAAAAVIPPILVDQLGPGGRMVVPVGVPGREQMLTVVKKAGDGSVTERRCLPVAFVPLVAGDGDEKAGRGRQSPR